MPDVVQLERFAYTPFGTFGRLYVSDFVCFTIERPWRDNAPNESCIPEGEYEIRLGRYNSGDYPAYEIMGVPDRTLIKIHIGNTMDDVLGCVAPGEALGWIERKWAVTSSEKAFKEFMAAMDGAATARLHISPYTIGASLAGAPVDDMSPQGQASSD